MRNFQPLGRTEWEKEDWSQEPALAAKDALTASGRWREKKTKDVLRETRGGILAER